MNWIVCPVRNGLQYTQAALPTFLAQDIGDVAVLFIDNHSTDGTTHWLRSMDGHRHVFVRRKNPPLSVAASWNYGLGLVFEARQNPKPRHEYALVVNNDVLLRPDTYRRLVEDGGQFVTGVGVNDGTGTFCWDQSDAAEQKAFTKSPHPSFSCFLIRYECFRRVGPFDERFHGAYCEDCDYHVRMHRAGIEAYAIDLPFYHAGSGTLRSVSEEVAKKIREQADANRALFREMYGCVPGTIEYAKLFE